MKRILSFVLCLVLVLPMLFACGDGAAPHTHAYGDYVTEQNATCTEEGVEVATCPCGDRVTRPLPAGHAYTLASLDVGTTPAYPMGGTMVCPACGDSVTRTLTSAEIGLPIVNITGSLDGISKENKVSVTFDYQSEEQSFTCPATLKVQGGTSADYPKKNFSVQFFEEDGSKKKVELCDGWGEESKYCMKANWTDLSAARNVVSAKLYGQVAATRVANDPFADLVNGGAVDGYPIAVYHEGAFLGLYTMNIPKDKWLFGMKRDESLRQAIIMGDQWHNSVSLREPMSYDFVSTNWELEYCSTEDSPAIGTDWAVDSFNCMMQFVQNNDGEAFRAGIGSYVNVERAIDALIYTVAICGLDNSSKNIIWVTYDGTVWTPCVYDLDSTWGMWWDASKLNESGIWKDFSYNTSINLLYYRLRYNYAEEIAARYAELRAGVLSDGNIETAFRAFFDSIPDPVYAAEIARWHDRPDFWINHEAQILLFGKEHLAIFDERFANHTW